MKVGVGIMISCRVVVFCFLFCLLLYLLFCLLATEGTDQRFDDDGSRQAYDSK